MASRSEGSSAEEDEYVLVTVDEYVQHLLRDSADYDISVRCFGGRTPLRSDARWPYARLTGSAPPQTARVLRLAGP